ncbi:MAG: ABC transporter substrate-binding protein [Planctomycetota bacterium]
MGRGRLQRHTCARRLLPLAAAVLLPLLGACGADPYPGALPGELHVPLSSAPQSLDPIRGSDQYSNTCISNLYDQLYEYDYYSPTFELKPCLAAAMPEVSEDALTYTIRLRKGVRYIDDTCFRESAGRGREVVASDVKFNILRLMDAKSRSDGTWLFKDRVVGLDAFAAASASPKIPKNTHRSRYDKAEGYPDVDGLEVVDDHTLRIHLIKPYALLPWILTMGYTSVYPPEAVALYGDDLSVQAVGSGPYRLGERPARLKHKLVFERNESYRQDLYPANGTPDMKEFVGQRMPFSPRVIATVFEEDQPAWLYFLSGYLDRSGIPKDSFDQAIDRSTGGLTQALIQQGINLTKDERLDIVYDAFNMEDPNFGSPAGERGLALRRAISLATDVNWQIEHLYTGRARPVQGPILEEFREFDPEFRNPWLRQPGETREAALDRARRVLAEAGYPGGVGAPRLTQDVSAGTTGLQFFQATQADLADIGLKIDALQMSFPDMLKRQRNKESQFWGVAWGADYPDAQNFFQLYYGPNKSPGSNATNFDDPEFNKLYEDAALLLPGPERDRMYRRMQEIVTDQCVWVFRVRRKMYTLVHPWLHGYRYNDLSTKYFKYCRVDENARSLARARLGKPNPWPIVWTSLVLLALVVTTFWAARNTRRAW